MAWYQAKGEKNDYSPLPAAKWLGKDRLLPPQDPQMGSQDYHLGQPIKTLAYAQALQYWAERAKPLIPSDPHHLAGSVLELMWAMEPLTTFEDSKVLAYDTAL